MQFAGFAIESRTVVIEDAVGYVAVFLYLGQEYAPTDGVDASGRDKDYIAFFDVMFG